MKEEKLERTKEPESRFRTRLRIAYRNPKHTRLTTPPEGQVAFDFEAAERQENPDG